MTKRKIVETLIQNTKKDIANLRKGELSDLQDVHDGQGNENRFENTIESETTSVLQEGMVIDELDKQLQDLSRIDLSASHDTVSFGALVTLNTGTYLVSHAFSAIEIEGAKVTGISTEAPLYQKMKALKKGAEFELEGNKTHFVIEKIQ